MSSRLRSQVSSNRKNSTSFAISDESSEGEGFSTGTASATASPDFNPTAFRSLLLMLLRIGYLTGLNKTLRFVCFWTKVGWTFVHKNCSVV